MSDFVHHRSGSGSPLLLLHGFTDTWHTWKPVIPALEREHDVIVMALPGHVDGFQFEPGTSFSLESTLDQLERQCDAAGLEQAHLVGNSLGGWAALLLAARGRATSVVGLSPGGGWEHGSKIGNKVLRYFARNYRLLRIGGPHADLIASRPRLRALALRDVCARPGSISASDAAQLIRGAYECPIFKEALRYSREEGLGDLPNPIAADIPVRIAVGTRDRIIRWPSYYERLRTIVPHAEWIELDGLGHLPMWDDADLTARTILEFTTAHEPAVSAAS